MMFFSQKEAWDAADPRRGPPPQRTSQQEGTMNTSTHPLGTLIETDVLVIGSGASGCGAALGAREQGLRVLLMDKGKLESSGCIGGGNDHYMAVLDEEGVAHDAAEDLDQVLRQAVERLDPSHAAQRLVRPHEAHA